MTDVTTGRAEVLPPSRDYEFRLRVEYTTDKAFEVEACSPEDLRLAINAAVKVLWPATTNAVPLAQMNEWLGW